MYHCTPSPSLHTELCPCVTGSFAGFFRFPAWGVVELCSLLCLDLPLPTSPKSPLPPITAPEPGSAALRLSCREHACCGSRSPRAWRLPGCFTLAGWSRWHNEHRWLREQRRGSEVAWGGRGGRGCSCACTCLRAVADCWNLNSMCSLT